MSRTLLSYKTGIIKAKKEEESYRKELIAKRSEDPKTFYITIVTHLIFQAIVLLVTGGFSVILIWNI